MLKKLVTLEPVFSAASVQAGLALVVALGFHLSAGVTGGIEAAAAAVLGLLAAAAVNKIGVTVWTGLFSAAGTLAVAFGVPHVTSGVVSSASAILSMILASLLREKVTPVAATRAKPAPAPAAPAA